MFRAILPALALAAATATSAAAAPAAPSKLTFHDVGQPLVEQVQWNKKKWRDHRKFDRGYKQGFKAGSRHSHAPRGWKRHSLRPSYWNTRGCVIVGPFWYCP